MGFAFANMKGMSIVMRKRLFAAVLASALIAGSFAGCSDSSASSSQSTESGSGSAQTQESQIETTSGDIQTVEFWHGLGGDRGQFLEDIIQEYNNSQSDVSVTSIYQGNYYDLSAKLQAAVASGAPPQVVQLEIGGIGTYLYADALVDMKQYMTDEEINDFIPGLMTYSVYEDQIVSLPFNRSTPLFYYNKDQFAEVGLDPEKPPTTWAELDEYATKLSNADRNGYSVPIDTWYYQAAMMAAGGELFNSDETSIGFNSEAGTKPLYFWKDQIDKGNMKVPPGKEYNASEMCRSDFASGKVSMIVQSTGSLTELEKNCDFNVGAAFLPKDERYSVPTGGANIIMIKGSTAEVEQAAWQFTSYMSSTEVSTKWSIGTGYFPFRTSSINSDEFKQYVDSNPNVKISIDQLEHADMTISFNPNAAEIKNVIIMNEIQKCMLEENYTPEQAIEQITKDADALLK